MYVARNAKRVNIFDRHGRSTTNFRFHKTKMADGLRDKLEPFFSTISPIQIAIRQKDHPLESAPFSIFDPSKETLYLPIFNCPKLVPPPEKRFIGITAVFDLDETLVDARIGSEEIYLRPYTREVLGSLDALDVEILVWSAGDRSHVLRCLSLIDPIWNEDEGTFKSKRRIVQYAVYRGPTWLQFVPSPKDICQLNGRHNRSILVDNSPVCACACPCSTIVVPDFYKDRREARNDTTLLYAAQIIARCHAFFVLSGASPVSISDFSQMRISTEEEIAVGKILVCHPFLQLRTVMWPHPETELTPPCVFTGVFMCLMLDVADSANLATRVANWHEPKWKYTPPKQINH